MNPYATEKSGPSKNWRQAFPVFGWLGSYDRSNLRLDLAAGITLAAYLLPAAIGDASLANLPPEAGLYSCLFGGLLFWIFCSSRHTSITVTSAISLVIGSSLGEMAGGDPTRFAALAACVALLIAAIAFVAWLVKAGAAVNFISDSVMLGFKAGVALKLSSTQLPKLFGVKGGHGDFWECMAEFFRNLGETHIASLLVGLSALMLLILGKKILPNKPVALFVVIGGIAAASLMGMGEMGVRLLGDIPSGIPAPSVPDVSYQEVLELLPLALACFLLGAVESAAIGKMFAEKHGYRFDANQELLAVSASNLAAGLGKGFPVSGGMSQSLVNESGGARSPLSNLFASAILLLVALFFTGLLRNLPQPVLAAIVLMAVASLFKLEAMVRLWKVHRGEFYIVMAALAGVLWAGLLKGVMLGAIISLVLLIRRASKPQVAFLGRIPGTNRYSDLARHPDNELTPGILPFRVEAGIMYFNTEHISSSVIDRLDATGEPVNVVIWDLSTSPYMDIAGARMVLSLYAELAKRGINLRLVEARSSVRDMLRTEGVDEKIGEINRWTSLSDVIENPKQKE